MSGWFDALPSFVQSIGTLQAGREGRENADEDAAFLEAQGREASNQALRDEEAQRRAARMALGRMSAAVGEAGGGYGGSAGQLLEQSDVLAELDALNIRYGGQMRRSALRSQAAGVRRSAPGARQTNLLAGAQLLRGVSGAYKQRKVSRA